MNFVGFLSEVCWISQKSLLDFSVKFVGFLTAWDVQPTIYVLIHYLQANTLSHYPQALFTIYGLAHYPQAKTLSTD